MCCCINGVVEGFDNGFSFICRIVNYANSFFVSFFQYILCGGAGDNKDLAGLCAKAVILIGGNGIRVINGAA